MRRSGGEQLNRMILRLQLQNGSTLQCCDMLQKKKSDLKVLKSGTIRSANICVCESHLRGMIANNSLECFKSGHEFLVKHTNLEHICCCVISPDTDWILGC